jgi:hypothetical protein
MASLTAKALMFSLLALAQAADADPDEAAKLNPVEAGAANRRGLFGADTRLRYCNMGYTWACESPPPSPPPQAITNLVANSFEIVSGPCETSNNGACVTDGAGNCPRAARLAPLPLFSPLLHG